ncbi:MAG: ABC transporter permease [Verrucomicrobia bacterium]|nr:ABC transporter permease [Verrucomicrobiota bacterium]
MEFHSKGLPATFWTVSMAWRDSRGQRKILLLFMLCVAAGIGALVAVASLRDNLDGVIELQSRSLLGADLELATRQPFTPELLNFAQQLGGEQATEVRLRSMAFFPQNGESRFVQVRAVEGGFPFYGESETEPAGLLPMRDIQTRSGLPPAIVENSLLQQLALETGETIRLGTLEFEIAGSLLRVAGESELGGFFAPRIYIRAKDLAGTGLLTTGSIARHRMYFQFTAGLGERERSLLNAAREDLFIESGVEFTTVESRSRNLRRVMNNIFDFLNLIGFVALVLGGIGVGGAVQVYIKEKLNTMALLRCLGTSATTTFRIYLWQIVAIGFLGSTIGSAIGVSVQFLLPVFFG